MVFRDCPYIQVTKYINLVNLVKSYNTTDLARQETPKNQLPVLKKAGKVLRSVSPGDQQKIWTGNHVRSLY